MALVVTEGVFCLQIVQNQLKEMPRLSAIIKAYSGRTERRASSTFKTPMQANKILPLLRPQAGHSK